MIRPDAVQAALSCHIRIDGERFYFGVHARFTPEQIRQIQACANDLILRNADIHDERAFAGTGFAQLALRAIPDCLWWYSFGLYRASWHAGGDTQKPGIGQRAFELPFP